MCFKQSVMDSIADIDKLFLNYDLLFNLLEQKEPDNIELAAIAAVIHSFYNGIEGIFILVAKQIDNDLPKGNNWHKILLAQMTVSNGLRDAVITKELALRLAQYMQFRHFFRHAYSFSLSWDKIKPLVDEITNVWLDFKIEITKFLNKLKRCEKD